jgi:cell division protein FtsI (penicillin-binding protein 3)
MVSIKQDIIKRVYIIYACLGILALAVIGRIYYVQNVQGERWMKLIQRATLQERIIPANRGNIFSDNGSLLATSLPEYVVGFDPKVASNSKRNERLFKEKVDSMCYQLTTIFTDKNEDYFKNKILKARKEKRAYIILGDRNISFEEKKKLENFPLIKAGKYKSGIVLERKDQRVHPFNNMGLRTIGYKLEQEGKGVGIEKSMEQYLMGRPGKGLFEKISGGSWKPIEDGPESKPITGSDVYTTLDVNIQDETETALKMAVEKYQPNYATAIVMEVKSGEIKALANLSFSKTENAYSENLNYAVAGGTTPGSTFKLPTMLALLEEGLSPNDSVDTGNGEYFFRGKRLTDSHRGGFGKLSVQQVFEKSSNIGIVKLVMNKFGTNENKYYDYLKKFKLDQKLGFQIKGESKPIFYFPGHKGHSALSMPWTAFGGYESALTPLQMLTFYNAIANDGYWVQPIIVKYIKNADHVEVDFTESQRKLEEPLVSLSTIKKVKKMMEGVVEKGTARSQRSDLYRFAGKTGTSIKNINSNYSKGKYYTAFAGYFPAENPKYSIIVVIDEPKGQNSEMLYAGDVAAPVFRQIADHIYADDLSLNKKYLKGSDERKLSNFKQVTLNEDFEAVNEEHKIDLKKANINVNANLKSEKSATPNVVGLPLRDALYILENKNFKVRYKGIGKVKKQSIAPGTMAKISSTIDLDMF